MMVKLSDRLQVLADQIGEKETMADIGTDHGFLPVYLWQRGISPKVIFTDVSAGSLEKSRLNARRLCPRTDFDFRLGNGLEVLSAGEVDDVVIAGMGGILMTRILGKDMEKTKSFSKLILQPRNGQGKLRFWLIEHGFSILRESLVREGAYICPVLTAAPQAKEPAISYRIERRGPEAIEYEVPPWIGTAGELAAEFVKNKIAAEERVLCGLRKSRTPDPMAERSAKERIAYLQKLLGGI